MNATKHKTKISWTQQEGFIGAVWNPTTGCTPVSEGCDNCYAAKWWNRFNKKEGLFEEIKIHTKRLDKPLGWKEPHCIFVNSMSDLFHKDVPFEFIASVFGIMALTPQHRYMILTKRPDRMLEFFEWSHKSGLDIKKAEDNNWNRSPIHTEYPVEFHIVHSCRGYSINLKPIPSKTIPAFKNRPPAWPLPNVLLGVTVENQEQADIRIPLLVRVPAALRFLSIEPMLGPIDLKKDDYTFCLNCSTNYHSPNSEACPNCGDEYGRDRDAINCINWVILGGESGSIEKARPMKPEWALKVKQDCLEAGIPFNFKQWGRQEKGALLEGKKYNAFPEVSA